MKFHRFFFQLIPMATLALSLSFPVFATSDDSAQFSKCAFMIKLPDGKFTYEMADMDIIRAFGEKELGASLNVDNADNIISILCVVKSVIPTEYDLKVIMTGRIMMRMDFDREGEELISSLEIIDGQIAVKNNSGMYTPDELNKIQNAVNVLQTKYQDYNEN